MSYFAFLPLIRAFIVHKIRVKNRKVGTFLNDNLYILLPAYNEAENIEDVIKSWYPLLEGKGEASKIVVDDSGSTDSTHEILLKLQCGYPKLKICSNPQTQHGPKVIALYHYAITQGAGYIFQTDSDGQTNPDEFNSFWELRNEYDAIIGKRLSRGDGKIRLFIENILCKILYVYFGVSIPDANAPFRLMKTELVVRYLKKMPDDYNLPNVMLTTFFVFYKENIKFENISFRPRQGGTNKISLKKITKIGAKSLLDFYHFRKMLNCTNKG